MGKYLWMAVTADKYELPLCVADTARELAEKYNITPITVITHERGGYSGRNTGRRYVKVLNDKEETQRNGDTETVAM